MIMRDPTLNSTLQEDESSYIETYTPLKHVRSSLPTNSNAQMRLKRTMTSKLENSVEEIENDEDATVVMRASQVGKLSGQKSFARLGTKFTD